MNSEMIRLEPSGKQEAKHTAKDSVFTDLFAIPKYLLQLYRALHPEDQEITEENISNVTIHNVLLDQCYNDLGFLVGNRLLVLAEAQSTWTVNILVRSLLETIQICRDENILKEYLESREKEVVNIMMTLFDDEYILKTYIAEKEKEAAEKAFKKAVKKAEKVAQEASKKAAVRLHQKGMPVADIADALSVTEKEMEEWLGLIRR